MNQQQRIQELRERLRAAEAEEDAEAARHGVAGFGPVKSGIAVPPAWRHAVEVVIGPVVNGWLMHSRECVQPDSILAHEATVVRALS